MSNLQPVLIDGVWRQADVEGTFEPKNPATKEATGETYPVSSLQDVEEAIAAMANLDLNGHVEEAGGGEAVYDDGADAGGDNLALVNDGDGGEEDGDGAGDGNAVGDGDGNGEGDEDGDGDGDGGNDVNHALNAINDDGDAVAGADGGGDGGGGRTWERLKLRGQWSPPRGCSPCSSCCLPTPPPAPAAAARRAAADAYPHPRSRPAWRRP